MKNITLLLCLLLMISGCQQRYWYRMKFDFFTPKPRKKVAVIINNYADDWLEPNFDKVMQKKCEIIFKRKKFDIASPDTADFVFYLDVIIDSFNVAGIAWRLDEKSRTDVSPYSYKRQGVKAIMFNYKMVRRKEKVIEWKETNDLFYYDDYRDLGRSVGMVRYTIKRKQSRP